MFKFAKPIFPKGKNTEMNVFAAFKANVPSLKGAEIKLAAYTFYSLYVNGEFVAFGPARTAKGYARVDVIDLYRCNGILLPYAFHCLSAFLSLRGDKLRR